MTKLGNLTRCHDIRPIKEGLGNNVNIYITSDEEIKEGDWFHVPNQMMGYEHISNEWFNDLDNIYAKKIILTTDQDLIKDGVQAIDDEFLEWFVGKAKDSGKPIDIIEIQKDKCLDTSLMCDCVDEPCRNKGYKIVIPKEEPKQDEDMSTLETQYKTFLKGNPNTKMYFEEWEKVNARLIKQAIINMMKADEELGVYDEPKPFKDMLSTDGDEWNEFKRSPFPSKKEPFKHKVEVIPAKEILANRSNAYEFINMGNKDLDVIKHFHKILDPQVKKAIDEEVGKQFYKESDKTITMFRKTKELNPHIGPFLLKNGFEKFKYEENIYTNSECTINVLEGCYEILFENEWGEVSAYTDSWSIPHLVGTLTWNDLIDKNYNK
jgi:hypothetical protein